VSLFFSASGASAALNCPDPPQQLSKDVIVDTKGKLGALGKLVGAELSNRTEVLTRDTLKEYPNADKLLLTNAMTSLFCQLLRDSTTVPDADKLNRFEAFSGKVMATVANSNIGIPRELESKFLSGPDNKEWALSAPAEATIRAVGLNCLAEIRTNTGYWYNLSSDGEVPVVGPANSAVAVTIKLVGTSSSSAGRAGTPDGDCHGKFIVVGHN
jgi:hypothetical protein